jgi:hypothetical protein
MKQMPYIALIVSISWSINVEENWLNEKIHVYKSSPSMTLKYDWLSHSELNNTFFVGKDGRF